MHDKPKLLSLCLEYVKFTDAFIEVYRYIGEISISFDIILRLELFDYVVKLLLPIYTDLDH